MNERASGIDGTQRRTKTQETVIESLNRKLEFRKTSVTTLDEVGNINTIDSGGVVMVNGEAVSVATQIAGQCQVQNCGVFLTHRIFRFCHRCSVVICPRHSKWDNRTGVWLCKNCLWIVRIRRFFGIEGTRAR